jgi:hypothetical protein
MIIYINIPFTLAFKASSNLALKSTDAAQLIITLTLLIIYYLSSSLKTVYNRVK